MKRWQAWGIVAVLLGTSIAAFTVPIMWAAALAAGATIWIRRRRTLALGLLLSTVAVNVVLLGFLASGEASWTLGWVPFGWDGAALGLRGGIRLAAVLAVNLAVLSWVSLQRLVDGLALPASATAFLGAVLLAMQDLGRDLKRLVDAARLNGTWPATRLRRAGAAARLLPNLLVLAVRRGTTRSEALRLAGHDTGPQFAALVAVTALATAGRMAFVAIPNVSLTYVVVFAGGFLFGSRIGAAAGALAMLFSDLLLTGLTLVPFANVPAMAVVGWLGGATRSMDLASGHWVGRAASGAIGFVVTFTFSAAADVVTWLLVPEFRGNPDALEALLIAGFIFNSVPALVNAALFASAVAPLARAAQAVGWLEPQSARRTRKTPAP